MNLIRLREILQKVIEDEGFRLYDISEYQENEEKYLQVVIDKHLENISLDNIVSISEIVNKALDDNNEITESFILDVTSSGAEKELKFEDLSHFTDTYIKVKLNEGVKGYNEIVGNLLTVDDETLVIQLNEKGRIRKFEIAKPNIIKINRAIKF